MLHMVGYHGTSPEAEAVLRQSFPRKLDLSSSSGRCILSKAPVKIADILLDPAYQLNRVQYRSLLAVPMLQGGEAIGAIVVTRLEAGEIPDKWVGLLQAFADQAVIAIQNVRLFNETQEALAHQTVSADILRVISSSPTDVQPVFEAIVEAAASARQRHRVRVANRRQHGHTRGGRNSGGRITPLVAPSMPVDADHNFPSRAILSRSLLHLPDWSALSLPPLEQDVHDRFGMRSALLLPLMRGDECLGVLVFGRNKPREFSPKDIALAESFRDQAVIAIENTRLFNETQEALAQQTASADILRVISSSPTDVQPVFEAIVGTAVKHLGCDLALVQTVSGDTYSPQAMATPAGLAPVPGAQRMPVDPTANFPSRAIRSKTMLHVPDWTSVELPAHEQVRHQQLGLNSALYLPLLRGDECVGVLVLGSRNANAFKEKAVALAESFRDQALIAIENTRLFNETQEALERQTATAEILAVISESPTDVQPVFQAIAERARTLCGADVGATTRLDGDVVHLAGVRALSTQAEDAMRGAFPMAVDARRRTSTARSSSSSRSRSLTCAWNRVIPTPNAPNGWASAASCRCRCCTRGGRSAPSAWRGASRGALPTARWRCCRPSRARR